MSRLMTTSIETSVLWLIPVVLRRGMLGERGEVFKMKGR